MNVHIKVNGTNYGCSKTLDAANNFRLKPEIRYLMICYKQTLYKQLYPIPGQNSWQRISCTNFNVPNNQSMFLYIL